MREPPKAIPNYHEKAWYLARRQRWTCPISGETVQDLHHRLHNTRPNRRRFPRLIHSMLNLVAVNHDAHLMEPGWGRMRLVAADRMEATLARWPRAEAFVNGRTPRLEWER